MAIFVLVRSLIVYRGSMGLKNTSSGVEGGMLCRILIVDGLGESLKAGCNCRTKSASCTKLIILKKRKVSENHFALFVVLVRSSFFDRGPMEKKNLRKSMLWRILIADGVE